MIYYCYGDYLINGAVLPISYKYHTHTYKYEILRDGNLLNMIYEYPSVPDGDNSIIIKIIILS